MKSIQEESIELTRSFLEQTAPDELMVLDQMIARTEDTTRTYGHLSQLAQDAWPYGLVVLTFFKAVLSDSVKDVVKQQLAELIRWLKSKKSKGEIPRIIIPTQEEIDTILNHEKIPSSKANAQRLRAELEALNARRTNKA